MRQLSVSLHTYLVLAVLLALSPLVAQAEGSEEENVESSTTAGASKQATEQRWRPTPGVLWSAMDGASGSDFGGFFSDWTHDGSFISWGQRGSDGNFRVLGIELFHHADGRVVRCIQKATRPTLESGFYGFGESLGCRVCDGVNNTEACSQTAVPPVKERSFHCSAADCGTELPDHQPGIVSCTGAVCKTLRQRGVGALLLEDGELK